MFIVIYIVQGYFDATAAIIRLYHDHLENNITYSMANAKVRHGLYFQKNCLRGSIFCFQKDHWQMCQIFFKQLSF